MSGERNIDVAAIRDAAEKATPGPWHWESEGFMGCGQVFTMGEHVMGGSIAGPTGDCYPRSGYSPMEDMQFIATMDPPTTLALLDALDAARAEVEGLTREADEAIAQAERWSEDAAVLERERANIAERLAMDYEKQAQKCRAVTPNDYTEGSHDAYLSAARIAREVGKA